MRRLKYIAAIFLTLCLILVESPVAPAAAQAPTGSRLSVIASDGRGIVLELNVAGFEVEVVEHGGQSYRRVVIPGMDPVQTPGAPQVPVRGALLGVPALPGVSVDVLSADYEVLTLAPLYPAPRIELTGANVEELRAEGAREIFTLNEEIYSRNGLYPGPLVQLGDAGYMRDQAVVAVQFYPVQYNPVTGEVRLYRRIVARVAWEQAPSIQAAQARTASPAYERLLHNTLLNYANLERPPLEESTPPSGGSPGIIAMTSSPRLKIGVTQDGVYQLNPGDLTGAGFDLSGVALSSIKLKNKGIEVPLHVHDSNSNNLFDGSDYILFYGTAVNDMYTAENIYWLEAGGGSGRRMSTRNGSPAGAAVPTHFPATAHAEQDTHTWQFMPGGGGQDHWFWYDKITATGSRDYSVSLNHISTTAGTASVRVQLKGYTDIAGSNPDHHTQIVLNGNQINDLLWNGQVVYNAAASVSHGTLLNGNNTVQVKAVKDLGVPVDQVYVNWIEVDYWDTYVAENDQLRFRAPENGTFQFEVTGFTGQDVEVFDVTDPANPVRIANAAVTLLSDTYRLQFQDTAETDTGYLALTTLQRKTPARIVLDRPSAWKTTGQGADYLIITHRNFYAETLELAAHRSSQGLSVYTIDVEDLYDEFNYGIFNPQAIRDFLSYAYQNWNPVPTYVLLVGDAHYDYRDNLGTGAVNYVPSQLVETSSGQTASDNWFAEVSGSDSLPDLLIGRLTPRYATHARDMIDKIISYEENPPASSWNKNVLLVADDGHSGDGFSDAFEITSEELAGRLPSYYTANKIYVRNYPPGDPRLEIANRINSGTLLVSYAGHGSVDTWAYWTGGWTWRASDVQPLSNTHKLPMVIAANCLNGYFVDIYTSMAEEFLRVKDEGAVAMWAATSLGYPTSHRALLGAFYDAIFEHDVYGLGQATTEAKFAAYSTPGGVDLAQTFVLFGDPAMRLGIPPYVESTTPSAGAVDVAFNQPIQITFSKSMNPASVVLSGPGAAGLSVTPGWNAERTLLTYQHTPFPEGRTLSFTIQGEDDSGVSLGAGPVPTTWSFTTLTAPDAVAISGPPTGYVQQDYAFTAGVLPITTTLPLTYTWQASGQAPIIRTGDSLSDTIHLTWGMTGTQTITVTARNIQGAVTHTHVITIAETPPDPGPDRVFLPIVIRGN